MYRRSKKKTKYIVRFDDLCPTMNWDVWNAIVEILDAYNVKPIIAVIPNNQDVSLEYQNANDNFWEHIHTYQEKGWMVALHGFNHVYTNHNPGIMGISANSEFATLPYDVQNDKIRKGIEIFNKEEIMPQAFIAPSHSFDSNTLNILKENNVHIISDGHISRAYKDDGILWIPCQLWDCFSVKKAGLYTVCYHHNTWDLEKIEMFRQDIETHIEQIICPFELGEVEDITWNEKCRTKLISMKFKIKRIIKKILGVK